MLKRQRTLCLDGTWLCIADPEDKGSLLGFMHPNCNTGGWREAPVPGTFEDALPEKPGYEGVIWFRRRFSFSDCREACVWLEFLAVNYKADVWLNGVYVGQHRGGFLPFRFEVRGLLKPGDNLLCVRTDNRTPPGTLPTSHGWRRQGGPIRSVRIYETPALFLKGLQIDYSDSRVNVKVTVTNATESPKTGTLRIYFPEFNLEQTEEMSCPPGGDFSLLLHPTFRDPALWTPEHPTLYRAEAAVSADGHTDRCAVAFGLRTLQTDAGTILLNGKPIVLRGFNRHEDSPRTGMAADAVTAEKDFRLIKKLGGNFVRLCHYPHAEEELDLCDRLGLIAFCEIPFNAAETGREEPDPMPLRAMNQVYLEAQIMLREMIDRDYNHPSVFFWSAGNECNESDSLIREMNDGLVAFIRHIDPTRFAVHVSMGGYWNGRRGVEASLFTNDDVICLNSYSNMEYKEQYRCPADPELPKTFWKKQRARLEQRYPGKPVVVTEFGFPTGKPYDGTNDEEEQKNVIAFDLAPLEAPENRIAGYAIWALADHRWALDREGNPIYGTMTSTYGVFRFDRTPKLAAHWLAEHWKRQEESQ